MSIRKICILRLDA